MCSSWLTVALTLATLTLSTSDPRRGSAVDNAAAPALDRGVLERALLQQARVEAVKRGILQQLGLTEAPRPPAAAAAAGNRSAAQGSTGGRENDDDRSVMAAYRRTVAQTRRRAGLVGNDVVVDDVTGNDVTHDDAPPPARQFYSFKGHGEQSVGDHFANKVMDLMAAK